MGRWVLLLVSGLLTAGCLQPIAPALPQTGDAQFYVSNQSFKHPEADVRLWVDGRLVFDWVAAVEDEHNWISFWLELANGTHLVRAREADTGAAFQQTFTKDGPVWVVIDFWTWPARFTMGVSRSAPVFE